MNKIPLVQYIVRAEYAVAASLVAVFYVSVGDFDWYWLPILFIVFDISMLGYLFNAKIGAVIYNLGHSIVGPGLLAIAYIETLNDTILFLALLWLFHIFIDRALGYGLKHSVGFKHTHMGHIGKV